MLTQAASHLFPSNMHNTPLANVANSVANGSQANDSNSFPVQAKEEKHT